MPVTLSIVMLLHLNNSNNKIHPTIIVTIIKIKALLRPQLRLLEVLLTLLKLNNIITSSTTTTIIILCNCNAVVVQEAQTLIMEDCCLSFRQVAVTTRIKEADAAPFKRLFSSLERLILAFACTAAASLRMNVCSL